MQLKNFWLKSNQSCKKRPRPPSTIRNRVTRRITPRWLSARAVASALILLAGLGFQAPAGAVAAKNAQIKAVRYWQSPESTRVVFDLSGAVTYTLSQDGQRIVLELPNVSTALKVDAVPVTSDLISRVRTESLGLGIRIVLELKRPARPKHFVLKPYQQYGDRLVVDLYDAAEAAPAPAVSLPSQAGSRDIIIAIDAGHGGDDPGAIGPGGTQEKQVTLAIAKRLAAAFNAQKGMNAVLTRTGDYFIPLARRPEIAREKKADLFISVHADGFSDHRARGASVWTLSSRRARGEMGRWLEDTENASDLIGGTESVSLGDKDRVLAEVLLDLSMTHSMSASYDVGKDVLKRIGSFAHLHKQQVQQASLKVLTSPDMPSILVETAFISNPNEEKLLTARAHQDKLIDAVVSGVRSYMLRRPPPGAEYTLKGGGPKPVVTEVTLPPAEPVATQGSVLPVSNPPAAADGVKVGGTPAATKPAVAATTGKPATTKPAVTKPSRPLYLNTIASSLEYAKRAKEKDSRPVAANKSASKPAPSAIRHKVKSGESLSGIAAHYKVSMNELRSSNRLDGDKVLIGQVLTIPN